MKTIICGPPHSGKSVMISNLERFLPSDSYQTIRVHRDGEGNWSNNPNQKEVQNVRGKAYYDEAFIKAKCDEIDRAKLPVVLIDIGGKLQEDKIPIFQVADSFIVISRDPELKMKWKDFGESLGVKCLALFDSCLDGEEEIYSNEDCLCARITNLERGIFLKDSEVLRSLARILLQNCQLREETIADDTVLDFNVMAKLIGCAQTDYSVDGEEHVKAVYQPAKAAELYRLINNLPMVEKEYKLYGARANWVSAIAVLCLKRKNNGQVLIYDAGFAEYVVVNAKTKKEDFSNEMLDFHILESDTCVFIDVSIRKAILTIDDFYQCASFPSIDESKELYISGKMPLWLTDSIVLSYDNACQYLFQPGIGFVCCKAVSENDLGSIVSSPEGIDVNGYFKAKSCCVPRP